MSVQISIRGQTELSKKLKALARKYPRETARALYEEGFGIQQRAVPMAPVDKAVLRTSAYTSPPTGKDLTVETGFGTKYAVYQHEKTELRHPRGGQAKYLETALNQRMTGMLERIGKRVADSVAKGLGTTPLPKLGPTRPMVAGERRVRGGAAARLKRARRKKSKR